MRIRPAAAHLFVGADAHIDPAECTVFMEVFGKSVTSRWADRVVGPYSETSFSHVSRRGGRLCPPAGYIGFTEIFGETAASQRADVGIGPYRTPANSQLPNGPMCTGKRQTHIRNAPSSRTAVTGIGPYSWRGSARGSRASAKIRSCSAASSRGFRGPSWSRWSARRWQGRNGRP